MNPEDGKVTPPRERGTSYAPGERPINHIVEYIGPITTPRERRKVRIYSDGTWVVGWDTPDRRRTVWHQHDDLSAVMRQHDAVVDSYLGRPISLPLKTGEEVPISLGSNIPQIEEELSGIARQTELTTSQSIFIVPGELEIISDLTTRLQEAMPKIASKKLTPEEERQLLVDIGDRIKRVRNLDKVEAKKRLLGIHESADEPLKDAFESYDRLLKRASEGASIASSLIDRGTLIMNWARMQDIKITNWWVAIGKALEDIDQGRIDEQRRREWVRNFTGNDVGSLIFALSELKGAPYSDLKENRAIKRLSTGQSAVMQGDQLALRELIGGAAVPLDRHVAQKMRDIKTHKYDRYKTRQQREMDQDSLEFYESRRAS